MNENATLDSDRPGSLPQYIVDGPAPDDQQAGRSARRDGGDDNAPTDDARMKGRKRLAQSLMLEEQGPGGIIRVAAVLIFALVTAFIFWSSYTQITEVVIASGEVSPVGSVKRVQHLEGGIVKEIRAREGDVVEAGEVIMVLEPSTAMPERDQMIARLTGLRLEADQLRSIMTGRTVSSKTVDPRYQRMATVQLEVVAAKKEAILAQLEVMERQISQKISEKQLLRGQQSSLEEQIGLLTQQVEMRMELMRKGLQPRLVMLDNERELARTQGQLAENKGEQQRTRGAIAELESRKSELHARMSMEAAEALGKINNQIAELQEAVGQVEDKVTRLQIRSPVRGILQNFLTETVGGVIAPGATVVEVIPLDADLVVEARVKTEDIGFVFIDQRANVKVVTYDFTRYGGINDAIERISATTLEDEKGNPFYRAFIRLDKNYVGDQPDRNLVVPGMTVIADIRTGQKTLAEYLLKPIYKAFSEAFRER